MSDLNRLGHAAESRGLYRHASVFWTKAANLGSADATVSLILLLRNASSGETGKAARWFAGRGSLDDPSKAAWLVDVLRDAGQRDAAMALAVRAAHHVNPDDPHAVGRLLGALRGAGGHESATALAARAAHHSSLDDPYATAQLVDVLRAAGQRDAAFALAVRAAHHVNPGKLGAVEVLRALLRAGAADAAEAFTARAVQAADHVSLQDPYAVVPLLGALRDAGQHEAATALAVRVARAIDHVNIYIWDPDVVARLVGALREAGEHEAATALATRAANAGKLNLDLEPVPHTAHSHKAGREPDSTPSQPWKWQEPPDHP